MKIENLYVSDKKGRKKRVLRTGWLYVLAVLAVFAVLSLSVYIEHYM